MAYLSVCHQAFLQLKCTEGRKEVDNLNDINRVNEALDLSLDLDIAGGGHASCCPCHSLLCVCMQTTSLGVPFFVSQERPSLRATQAQTQQEQQALRSPRLAWLPQVARASQSRLQPRRDQAPIMVWP